MVRRISETDLEAVEKIVRRYPGGVTAREIAREGNAEVPLRTLQYRLKYLTDTERLVKDGTRRSVKYRIATVQADGAPAIAETHEETLAGLIVPVSKAGAEIQEYVRKPPAARKPVGYDRAFLDSYRPNVSVYLSNSERAQLSDIGKPTAGLQPAGTYAKQILSRLLIDLSWNSSRLEGNTYSLLDTRRLIEFGEEADGKQRLDAQMILNHREAIEFLVGSAEEIGFNRYTILNLHAMLANNLLADPNAMGRLRQIAVGIEKSVFHPLEVPQLIEECFDEILATAAAIENPFEQAFFVMVQLPYLQPFDDVNKRVSRLAANIPLIKGNLTPLSFTDVPAAIYTEAILGIYERNKVDLLKDVFLWAYQRSAARYAAVRQSLGEPDPFRLQYRAALREVVGEVIRRQMDKKTAVRRIAAWGQDNIDEADREKFRDVAETELLGLHEGNFARYRIKPSEFAAWQAVWTGTPG